MQHFDYLTENVRITMAVILSVLIIATSIAKFFQIKKGGKLWTEIFTRIVSWWIIVGALFTVILLGLGATVGFIALLSFLALREYFSMVPTRQADRRALLWAYIAIPLQYIWAMKNIYGLFITFIPVFSFLLIPFRMIIRGETKDFLRAASTIQWGLMATVFSISHIAFLLTNLGPKNPIGNWPGLFLYLIILTELNDIAQFISGKTFGKHKIVPTVSPNKTAEGLVGGMIFTMILSVFLAPFLTPIQPVAAVGFGFVISFFGFIGDVAISAIKRDIGVKDTGSLIPGHGGILDRIDSLTYTAPLFYHLLWFYSQGRF